MMNETQATPSDIELQDRMMDAAAQKVIELTPEWIDVAAAGLRLYLTVCDQLGGPIPEMRFVHNNRPCKLQFTLNEVAEGSEFVANDIDHEKQMEICEAILATAEANENGHSLMDLAICSGRLFMIGYDGLAGTVSKVCFRFAKKNYVMNLVEAK